VTAAVLGIELGPRTLRAVRLDGWRAMRTSVLEVAWDGEHPDDAVRAVRDGLGRARRVAVAVPLALLVAKRVRLPPLPAGERRRILRLEPQRFFAVRLEEMAVAVRDDDFVFATREAPLAAWLRALEALGPVELVEPGPVSLARGLAAAGVADGVAVLDDPEHGLGMVELRGGEVTVARRPFGPLDVAAAAVREAADTDGAPRRVYVEPWSEARAGVLAAPGARSTAEPFPASGPVAGPFLTAYGAARGDGRDLAATLAPEELGAPAAARCSAAWRPRPSRSPRSTRGASAAPACSPNAWLRWSGAPLRWRRSSARSPPSTGVRGPWRSSAPRAPTRWPCSARSPPASPWAPTCARCARPAPTGRWTATRCRRRKSSRSLAH
jgi:hypothetical protein